MHNLITTEVKELSNKAMLNFREFYKDKEDRKTLKLIDFIIYAIIRGKDMDITVRDSNYKEGTCPMSYHKKFIDAVDVLRDVSTDLVLYFDNDKGSINPYNLSDVTSKVKVLFGLTKEEFELLFHVYFEIKTMKREKAA